MEALLWAETYRVWTTEAALDVPLCAASVIVTSGKCERCPIIDTFVRGLTTSDTG